MNIEELESKHAEIIEIGLGNTEEELVEYWFNRQKIHTKLSIYYTISVLDEILSNNTYTFGNQDIADSIENKIEELKQYLNE